jgi:thiol-disulfide isomerase/thioredoxin
MPMRFLPLFAVLLMNLTISAFADPPATVNVNIVKYDGLTDLVKKQNGKVVVVDFWADYCVPCKREFPKFVALHQKAAKDGMVAISVSLDDLSEDGAKDKVLKFLQKQQSTMTNVILDEKPEVWQKNLKIDGPPLVMVFNREGKLEQKFRDADVDYAVIEKLVTDLLKK